MWAPETIVQELYRRYGMVVDKDDPVVVAVLLCGLHAEDERRREEAKRHEYTMLIEEAYSRAQMEGQAAGEKQFAATEAAFFKRLGDSGEQVCQRIASAGQHLHAQIEQTATRLAEDRDRDDLAIMIHNMYGLLKGVYLALGSLIVIVGFGLLGKIRGWY